jgi:hypothetical protein
MQRRRWLQTALESLTVDEAKRMRELVAVLKEDDSVKPVADKVDALEELTGLIESIDNARGGWCVWWPCCRRCVGDRLG